MTFAFTREDLTEVLLSQSSPLPYTLLLKRCLGYPLQKTVWSTLHAFMVEHMPLKIAKELVNVTNWQLIHDNVDTHFSLRVLKAVCTRGSLVLFKLFLNVQRDTFEKYTHYALWAICGSPCTSVALLEYVYTMFEGIHKKRLAFCSSLEYKERDASNTNIVGTNLYDALLEDVDTHNNPTTTTTTTTTTTPHMKTPLGALLLNSNLLRQLYDDNVDDDDDNFKHNFLPSLMDYNQQKAYSVMQALMLEYDFVFTTVTASLAAWLQNGWRFDDRFLTGEDVYNGIDGIVDIRCITWYRMVRLARKHALPTRKVEAVLKFVFEHMDMFTHTFLIHRDVYDCAFYSCYMDDLEVADPSLGKALDIYQARIQKKLVMPVRMMNINGLDLLDSAKHYLKTHMFDNLYIYAGNYPLSCWIKCFEQSLQ